MKRRRKSVHVKRKRNIFSHPHASQVLQEGDVDQHDECAGQRDAGSDGDGRQVDADLPVFLGDLRVVQQQIKHVDVGGACGKKKKMKKTEEKGKEIANNLGGGGRGVCSLRVSVERRSAQVILA